MTTSTIELLSTDELIASLEDLNFRSYLGSSEEAKSTRAAIANLEIQWQEWLRREYLPGAPKTVAAKVFEIAWDDNFDGYSAVETAYIELAKLANIVRTDWA